MVTYMTSIFLFEIFIYLFFEICNIVNKLFLFSFFMIFIIGWKLMEKEKEEYWYGFIPFYNIYKLCEIVFGKNKGWYCILLFIPIVNLIMYPIYCNELRKHYEYEELFTVGLILLPIIFLPILAFDEKEYKEKTEDNHISKMAHWNNDEKTEDVQNAEDIQIKEKNADETNNEHFTDTETLNLNKEVEKDTEKKEEIAEEAIIEKIQEKMNEEKKHEN